MCFVVTQMAYKYRYGNITYRLELARQTFSTMIAPDDDDDTLHYLLNSRAICNFANTYYEFKTLNCLCGTGKTSQNPKDFSTERL